MSRPLLLLVFFIITATRLFGFEISGKAVGFGGEYIRLYLISDFISEQEIKVDVVKIDQDGSFKLRMIYPHNALVRLKIDRATVSIVTLKDAKLQIELRDDSIGNRGRIFDRQLLVEILNNTDKGVNKHIWAYQKEHANFLEKNYQKFVTKQILPEVKKFQIAMKQRFADVKMPYFNTYLNAELAALEDAVMGSEKTIYEAEIKPVNIAYDNVGYMNLFIQFYQERFIQLSQGKDGFQVLSAVNGTQDYDKLHEIVRKNPFIHNDTLAQLFIIFGLREVYDDETFKRDKILRMLDYIRHHNLNYFNGLIAKNVISELTFLQNGKPAPDFNLRDSQGQLQHLGDFLKKDVLLFFWAVRSRASMKDLLLIAEFWEKYHESVAFVGVNMDDDPAVAMKFLQQNPVRWQVLYKDDQYDVIDKYRVDGVPMYAVIDKSGKIVICPATGPEEQLESVLYRLISKSPVKKFDD